MIRNSEHADSGTDLFTVEVIKNALVAIGEEMFVALKRTSMSPVIYEALDYGIGITDASGRLIAQGNGIPGFIGTLDGAVQSIIEKHPSDSIRPGDIFIQNDPYCGGGTHLPDVCMVRPVFYDGQLIAWTANKAHWTEVGGKDPGSVSVDAAEIYQEGLQLPGLKIFDQDKPNTALIDLIKANVRLPEMTLGDMWSSIAALKVGENRFVALVKKYGWNAVDASINKLLDHAEDMVAEKFKSMPKGEFVANDVIDSDGLGHGPFNIQVKVTVSHDKFRVDYTGTDPQVNGPINLSIGGLVSAAREVFMNVVDPGVPANDGCFRRLEVVCPEGTLCSATRPAPVSSYFDVMVFAADVIRKALATSLPDKLIAGQYGAVCTLIIAGGQADGDGEYIMVQPLAGGWGAGFDKDGESGQFCVGNGETRNIPVEVIESRYPLRVERYALNPDGVGAGKFRGGLGLVLDYRVLTDAAATVVFGREITPPWGINGGQPGSCSYAQVLRSGMEVGERLSRGRVTLRANDVIRSVTGSGAGWGKPGERDTKLIQADIANGLLSPKQASNLYGIKAALSAAPHVKHAAAAFT